MVIKNKGRKTKVKIIKRDGKTVDYNSEKIEIAIKKANKEVRKKERATDEDIHRETERSAAGFERTIR